MYDAVREDERECLYFHDRYELSAEIDLAPALIALALGPRGWRVHAWVAGNAVCLQPSPPGCLRASVTKKLSARREVTGSGSSQPGEALSLPGGCRPAPSRDRTSLFIRPKRPGLLLPYWYSSSART